MHRSAKKSPLSLVALIGGIILAALLVIDGLPQWEGARFGMGVSSNAFQDSILAIFLVGMIVGMISGIGMFFGYLVWREKQTAGQSDDLEELFEELAREEEEALFVEDLNKASEEKAETLDPWEKPSDWWKRSKED